MRPIRQVEHQLHHTRARTAGKQGRDVLDQLPGFFVVAEHESAEVTHTCRASPTIVNVIGVVDIALAVIFLGLVAAVIMRKAVAYSPLAIGLFGWAALWGFATALSRSTAELNGKEIWDVVERGPNFLLPAGLVYLIYKVRQEGLARARSASANAGARPSAKPALTPST
jgi:hypothetical protein